MTNADLIRNMTDEELAKWLSNISVNCPNHGHGDYDCRPTCTVCWLDWLQTERGESE